MNKRQVLVFSLLSALMVSGFGIVNALAASSGTNNSVDKAAQLEERYGITLTDEQKTQIEAKEQEQETKKAEELAKWQNMTLDTWKAQEIERINATTQEDFDKMKERQLNMLENGKGGPMGEPKDMGEKPAE